MRRPDAPAALLVAMRSPSAAVLDVYDVPNCSVSQDFTFM
jgi:hypothetical protein